MMKNVNAVNIKDYLTIEDISYITGFAKNTIRTFCNKKHHSYRPDFPKPIKVNIGRAIMVFDRKQILKYIKKHPKFFSRRKYFEFEFSSPTLAHNYYKAQIYHKPTETTVLFKITQEEFELLAKYGFESIDTQILINQLLNKALKKIH